MVDPARRRAFILVVVDVILPRGVPEVHVERMVEVAFPPFCIIPTMMMLPPVPRRGIGAQARRVVPTAQHCCMTDARVATLYSR